MRQQQKHIEIATLNIDPNINNYLFHPIISVVVRLTLKKRANTQSHLFYCVRSPNEKIAQEKNPFPANSNILRARQQHIRMEQVFTLSMTACPFSEQRSPHTTDIPLLRASGAPPPPASSAETLSLKPEQQLHGRKCRTKH